MQKRRSTPQKTKYVQSGVAGHKTPGGRKPSNARGMLRLVLYVAVGLLFSVLAIYGITTLIGGSRGVTRIGALPTDNIQAFGENVLFYDGQAVRCVDPNGTVKWVYTVGAGANYSTDGRRVAIWTGQRLHVVDQNGMQTYVDQMDGPIRFARVGEAYVAVCIGVNTENTVRVMTLTGSLLEDIKIDDLYLLDIGFFLTRGETMWVFGMDIGGSMPVTKVMTYQPGHLSTGAIDLSDMMVYKIYTHNNLMLAVDTSKIRAYNYKCVEQLDIDPVLIYGWYVCQTRAAGKNTYALMQPNAAGSGAPFTELRLVHNYTTQALNLMSPCFASGLSDKGVYGFGGNIVYFAPYGSTAFKSTVLPYTVTGFVCMLDGGRAVLTAGDAVIVVKLPT